MTNLRLQPKSMLMVFSRATAVLVIASLSLSGCSLLGGSNESPLSASPRPSSESATPIPTEAPTLDLTLSAEENRPFFDSINTQTLLANPNARGRDLIDALVAAGFDKMAMEVGFDQTSTNEPIDSIGFTVLMNGECLVGQFQPRKDPDEPRYFSAVLPPLQGTCLVGASRPIDW